MHALWMCEAWGGAGKEGEKSVLKKRYEEKYYEKWRC